MKMKNLKSTINFTCIILGLAFMNPMYTINAQPTQVDSSLVKHYSDKLDSVLSYQTRWQESIATFEEASRGYCLFQDTDKEKADKILSLCVNSSFLPKQTINIFYLKNFNCFDESQRRIIRNNLTQNIQSGDPLFHEIVSIFHLDAKKLDLKNQLTAKALSSQLKDNLNRGSLEKTHIQELRNMATLANLDNPALEDSLLLIINSLHKQAEQLEDSRLNNFGQIIINTVPLLQSKKSIIQTLYLLDQKPSPIFQGHDDITGTDPAFSYFLSCIQPKLKDWKIKHLAWSDFEKNKGQIKEMIINDNSIWLDHIKIENK